jgi:hypothetical protein
MLNPSDANADENDATLRRCLNFAARSAADRGWADHRLAVVNLYGYVTKSPAKLRTAGYALCPVNDRLVLETCKAADLVICGWGSTGHAASAANTCGAVSRTIAFDSSISVR